jgi:hypothetical protein
LEEGLGVAASKRPDHNAIVPTLGVGTPDGRTWSWRSRAGIATGLAWGHHFGVCVAVGAIRGPSWGLHL